MDMAGVMISDIDWLAVAIGRIGGIKAAARRMKVQDRTVRNWKERGVGNLELNTVVQLAKLGGIPMLLLAERMGPFKGYRNAAAMKAGRELGIRA